MNEDSAMVIVDMGPACDIGIFRFSANKVGNQFLVAHPGKLGAAKYSRITQNAILLKSNDNPFNKLLFLYRKVNLFVQFVFYPSFHVEKASKLRRMRCRRCRTNEGCMPGKSSGYCSAETSDGLPGVEPGHVNTDG